MARIIDGREWVSLTEASQRLGLAYDTIRLRVRQHHITGQTGSDHQRYVPWDDIKGLVRKSEVAGRPPRPIDPDLSDRITGVRETLRLLEKAVKQHDAIAAQHLTDEILARAQALVTACRSA